MTRRRELEKHRKSVLEIRNIMNSMKNLAYLETRKLNRFIGAQRSVIHSMEEAAQDLLSHYPVMAPVNGDDYEMILLVGTERGFCGDFNPALLHELDKVSSSDSKPPALLVMGEKLQALLDDDPRVVSRIHAPSVSDEVLPVLSLLTSELVRLRRELGSHSLQAISHTGDEKISCQQLLPAFPFEQQHKPKYPYPPALTLSPEQALMELSDHYLFARLHGLLYDSLMAENLQRISHLDSAVHQLDEETENLRRQGNTLRQEEIIEEIEVILLNTSQKDEGE